MNGAKTGAKKPINPILLGVIVFFVMIGALFFNLFREYFADKLFAPQWARDFNSAAEYAKNDRDGGIARMEKALAEGEKTPNDFGRKMSSSKTLAEWYESADRNDDAKKSFLKGADYAVKAGGMPLENSNCLAELSLLEHRIGDKEGEAHAQKALDVKLKQVKPDHEWVGWVQIALALNATDAGHYEKAEKAWNEAIHIESRLDRHEGQVYFNAVNGLACTYALEGKRELADKTFFDNIRAADKRYEVGSWRTDQMIVDYARALRKAGDEKSAQLLLTRIEDEDAFSAKRERSLTL